MLGRYRKEEVCLGGRHRKEEVCLGDTGQKGYQQFSCIYGLSWSLVWRICHHPRRRKTHSSDTVLWKQTPHHPFCSAGRGGSRLQTCFAGCPPLSLGLLVTCCAAWHLSGFDTKKSLVPRSRKVPAVDETSHEASNGFIDLVEGRFLLSFFTMTSTDLFTHFLC